MVSLDRGGINNGVGESGSVVELRRFFAVEDFWRESRDAAQRRGERRRKTILYRTLANRRTIGYNSNGLDVLHVAHKGKNVFLLRWN